MQLRFIVLFVLFMGCSKESFNPNSASQTCGSGIAQIMVLDGSLIRICGCQEPNNQIFNSGQSLSCTINPATTVFFNFVSITVSHQISVTGGPTTPIFNQSSGQPTQTFPIAFPNSGNFPFTDIFFPSIGGVITVL